VAPLDATRSVVGVELQSGLPDARHEQGRQASADRPGRERRDREGLDVLVEGGVVVLEGLVVRQVPRPGPVVDRAHDAWSRPLTTDPAGGLDVLARSLRLSGDDHQAQPLDVDAHRHHVRRQEHVYGAAGQVLGPPLLA